MATWQSHFRVLSSLAFGSLLSLGLTSLTENSYANPECETAAVGQNQDLNDSLSEIISEGLKENGIESFDPYSSTFSCRIDGSSHVCGPDGATEDFTSKNLFESTYDVLKKNNFVDNTEKIENILVKKQDQASELSPQENSHLTTDENTPAKIIYYYDSNSQSVVQFNTQTHEKKTAVAPIAQSIGRTDFSANGNSFLVYDEETGSVQAEYRLDELFGDSKKTDETEPPTSVSETRSSVTPPLSPNPFEVLLTPDLDLGSLGLNQKSKLPGFFVLNPKTGELFYPEKLEAELGIKTQSEAGQDSNAFSPDFTNRYPRNQFAVNRDASRAYRIHGQKLQVYSLAKSIGSYFESSSHSEIEASIPVTGSDELGRPLYEGSLLLNSSTESNIGPTLVDIAGAFEAAEASNPTTILNLDAIHPNENFEDSNSHNDLIIVEAQDIKMDVKLNLSSSIEARDSIDRAFADLQNTPRLQILIHRLKPARSYSLLKPDKKLTNQVTSKIAETTQDKIHSSQKSPRSRSQRKKSKPNPQPDWYAVLNNDYLEKIKRALQTI